MRTVRRKLALDATMSIMLIAEMLVQVTGVFLHEILGAVLLATLIAHMALERKWLAGAVKSMRAGTAGAGRIAKAAIAALLAAATVAMAASSIVISTVLRGAGVDLSTLNPGGIWYAIHTASAYAICALAVVHLLSHWALVAKAVRIPYDPSRRAAIGTGVNVVAALGAVALGVAGAKALAPTAALAEDQDEALPEASDLTADGSESQSVVTSSTETESRSRKGKRNSNAPTQVPNSSSVADDNPSPSDSSETSGKASSAESGESSEADASTTCWLCREACPLSSPKCRRPYEAGII